MRLINTFLFRSTIELYCFNALLLVGVGIVPAKVEVLLHLVQELLLAGCALLLFCLLVLSADLAGLCRVIMLD